MSGVGAKIYLVRAKGSPHQSAKGNERQLPRTATVVSGRIFGQEMSADSERRRSPGHLGKDSSRTRGDWVGKRANEGEGRSSERGCKD